METTNTEGAAAAETGAEVTAAVVLEVVEVNDVLEVTDALEVEDDEVGVPGGQSEPASAGAVHGIISKKTWEHWLPMLAS